jgi:hypothetical protein
MSGVVLFTIGAHEQRTDNLRQSLGLFQRLTSEHCGECPLQRIQAGAVLPQARIDFASEASFGSIQTVERAAKESRTSQRKAPQ